jgi:hypothetical protein
VPRPGPFHLASAAPLSLGLASFREAFHPGSGSAVGGRPGDAPQLLAPTRGHGGRAPRRWGRPVRVVVAGRLVRVVVAGRLVPAVVAGRLVRAVVAGKVMPVVAVGRLVPDSMAHAIPHTGRSGPGRHPGAAAPPGQGYA